MNYITLNNGVKMPGLGYGTFRSEEGSDLAKNVKHAIKVGYRSIDTAKVYGNEEQAKRIFHLMQYTQGNLNCGHKPKATFSAPPIYQLQHFADSQDLIKIYKKAFCTYRIVFP